VFSLSRVRPLVSAESISDPLCLEDEWDPGAVFGVGWFEPFHGIHPSFPAHSQ
jgi:hypothetical protein